VRITDALYAVDQEDLSEKLVFAEFVSEHLLLKAIYPELPNQVGKNTILNKISTRKFQPNFITSGF
jgi:hypothetical protein